MSNNTKTNGSQKNIFGGKDIQELNTSFEKTSHNMPEEVVSWALKHATQPILTTNFRPYESALLHLCVTTAKKHKKKLPIVWCDTGYNTHATYKFKLKLEKILDLQIYTYTPQYTNEYINVLFGGIPEINSPAHKEFTHLVKLEPFYRAMEEHKPDLWFTNLRHGQTELRSSLNIFSLDKTLNIPKVSPFYYWKDLQLDVYLEENGIPNEKQYFDPTKGIENRECGLHK